VDAELKCNGNKYVTIEEPGGGQLGTHVKEEDVQRFFEGFKVDKVRAPLVSVRASSLMIYNATAYFRHSQVLRDYLGWYVTFQTSDSTRKAKTVLNAGTRTLAHTSVMLNVRTPPLTWTPSMRTSGPSAREASRRWREVQQYCVCGPSSLLRPRLVPPLPIANLSQFLKLKGTLSSTVHHYS
jgi:hypothetical protein